MPTIKQWHSVGIIVYMEWGYQIEKFSFQVTIGICMNKKKKINEKLYMNQNYSEISQYSDIIMSMSLCTANVVIAHQAIIDFA